MAKQKISWFEYDWRFEGDEARFGVNSSFYSPNDEIALPTGHNFLEVLLLSSAKGNAIQDKDFDRITEFLLKFVNKVDSERIMIAGYIRTVKLLRLYLYFTDKKDINEFETLFLKQKQYARSFEMKSEQDYSTLIKMLRPDSLKLQTINNAETIRMLQKKGDISAPRRMNLHLAFKNEPTLLMFCDTALKEGFAIGIQESHESYDLPCGIVLHRICAMKKRDVDSVTTHAIKLAELFDGRLLYWDCPIMASLKKR